MVFVIVVEYDVIFMFGFFGLCCDERPYRIVDEISLIVMIVV